MGWPTLVRLRVEPSIRAHPVDLPYLPGLDLLRVLKKAKEQSQVRYDYVSENLDLNELGSRDHLRQSRANP